MAFKRGSRYETARPFEAWSTSTGVFPGIRPRSIDTRDGVLEHTVQAGQRLDLVALHYYNDASMWWLILDANPELVNGGDLMFDEHEGETLLIPRPSGGRAPR